MPHATINTRWFQDQLADKQITQRKLARMMHLDPSAVSLMLRGKRAIAIEEATNLARILGVPLAEVLSQAGADLPKEPANESGSVAVDGWMDGNGGVHAVAGAGPTTAPRPPGAAEGTIAVRVMTDDYRDGWLVYYRPVDYIMPEAIGRMAIVEYARTGMKALRVVKHGYEPGQYRLSNAATGETETARIASASLVTWIRQ